MISASLCQELADLAMQDGAQHDELYALASTGNHGMYKGNIHRNLMAYFCKDLIVAPSMTVDVTCIDPKTNKDTIEGAIIFLPHLQFWSLGLHVPENFNDLFSLAWLWELWQKLLTNQRRGSHKMQVYGDLFD